MDTREFYFTLKQIEKHHRRLSSPETRAAFQKLSASLDNFALAASNAADAINSVNKINWPDIPDDLVEED